MGMHEPMEDAITAPFTGTLGQLVLYTEAPGYDTSLEPGTLVEGIAPQDCPLLQNAEDPSKVYNEAQVDFGEMPECDVVAVGYQQGGTLYYSKPIDPPVHFEEGDPATIDAGLFVIEFAG